MKCPGQDTRYWKPGDIFEIPCPTCGASIEFFRDEATRRCSHCGRSTPNPKMDFGCAAYCKYAAQCLGAIGPELARKRRELLKERVALEMKRAFGRDFRSISHAVKTALRAEEMSRQGKGDAAALIAAAYLHHLGAEKTRRILEDLGAEQGLVSEVIELVTQFSVGGTAHTENGKILSEAHEFALDTKGA